MTDLNEFVHVIDGYKMRQIEILTRPLRPGVKENRYKIMYHALAEGLVHHELECARLLGLDGKGRPFQRFLTEFRRRLFAPLLFLGTSESPNFNETQKANFECLRKLAIFQTLVYRHCPENACMLAKEIVELALANDVVLVALEMATFLKRYYVEQFPDSAQYRFYKAYVERLRQDWQAENKAQGYYQAVSVPAMKKKSSQFELATKAAQSVERLNAYKAHCNTIIFLAGYYALRFIEKMNSFQLKQCIEVCEEAIRHLDQKACSSPRIKGIFYGHKIVCLYMMEAFKPALELSLENIKREIEGSRGWFLCLEIHLFIALKAGEYEMAFETARKVYSNPNFENMPALIHESWNILIAYLAFVRFMDKNQYESCNLDFLHNFKLRKFLNDVPTFSKDKKGFNLPILIIQFLFLLLQNDHDQAHEKLVALRKYRVKHLQAEPGLYRTQLFIRALCTLAGSAFTREKFLKKSSPYLQNMDKVPKGYSDQHFRIEIIPYERLWQWVAELLV